MGSQADRASPAHEAPCPPGRVAARLARQVEVGLAAVDLSLPQYRVLMYLDEGEAASSKLAQHLAVSRPTVTSVVDGLVARGLVQRRHDTDDRRRIALALTEPGADLLAAADRSVEARLHEIVGHLPDEVQAAAALGSFDCWRDALDSYRYARAVPAR
jgi:long-chain acyl-CoA synthetase